MLKAAHLGGLIPPIFHPENLRRPERADRPTTLLFAGAIASFGLALVLIGAAACLAAGAPVPVGFDQSALVLGALAAACVLAAFGMVLALRERSLRVQHLRRTTRAERIQSELDSLGLTPKEMVIAKLILQHKSYADIAADRHLAVRTVQFHATNIFRKAYVGNRRDFERVILADDRDLCGRSNDLGKRTAQGSPPDGMADPLSCLATANARTPLPCCAPEDPRTHALARTSHRVKEAAPSLSCVGEREREGADRPAASPTTLRSRVALRQGR